MVARKRGREEMEASEPPVEPSMLDKLRNTWEFANLMQYIFIFGKAVKIDEDFDIEDLERECLKPEPSLILSEIGLALLKYVSSHRGLTPEIFDEYTRRQYMAKSPQRNPFGEEEEPKRFAEFDVFTKLKVLVQLSQWTLNNADRIREKMDERSEGEQSVAWRMNEIGYDRHDRYYFVLDDNRLYRRTEAPLPPPPVAKPKASSKKAKAAARSSKRRRTREAEESAKDADIDTPQAEQDSEEVAEPENDDNFGGRKWECVAITLGQYQDLLESFKKSRDPDEKALYRRITEEVLPIIEQAEASQFRKKQRQERELLNLQKLATAKRSSRLEAKMERERQDREEYEAEQKRKAGLAEAHAYEKKQQKMDEDRESRMMTREQRLKERELKRILHEEELAKMSEEEKRVDAGESRLSERHLKAEMEKKKKELAALEEDVWFFDCSKCGVHGDNLDDGTHSVACENCNVWQHSACLGISQAEAEKDDFHFICRDCKRREEDAKKPKIPSLKFKLASSNSPPNPISRVALPATFQARKQKLEDDGAQPPVKRTKQPDHVPHTHAQPPRPPQNMQIGVHTNVMDGPTLPPYGQLPDQSPQALRYANAVGNTARRPSQAEFPPAASTYANGYSNYGPQADGYGPQALNQSFQAPPFTVNGHHQVHHDQTHGSYQTYPQSFQTQAHQPQQNPYYPQQSPGWSARYVPPTPHQSKAHSPHRPPPSQQNPFANTLNNSNTPSSQCPNPPPGADDANSSSSTKDKRPHTPQQHQHETPFANSARIPPQSSSSSYHVNGHTPSTNNAAYTQPFGPPSQSPTKHPSPPAARSTNPLSPSSSPVTHKPILQANGPTSPGFSPVKHYSPRQQALPPTHGLAVNPNALPPVTKLAPSPTQQSLPPPVKAVTPDKAVSAKERNGTYDQA